MAEFSTLVEIEAPPEVVFDHLVKPEQMTAWMGQHAVLDAVPGGEFTVDINGYLIRGEYIEVEPPKRVVVSWGMEGAADLPPGHSRVEFTLTPTRTGTRLHVLHTGLPETRARNHAAGWGNYLDRLRLAATGADPGRDDFRPSITETKGVGHGAR